MKKKKENLTNKGGNFVQPNVKRSVYGFEIGKHRIDIKAESEQKAMIILIKKFWNFIDDNGKIELLGECK